MEVFFERASGYMFAVELSICYVFFVFRLPKKNHFWLRVVIYLIVIIGASAVGGSEWEKTANLLLVILRYVILFAISICAVPCLFKVSALTALYCGAAAYALQNCSYRIGELITQLIYTYTGSGSFYINTVTKFVVDIVVYSLLGLFFLRQNYIDEKVCRNNKTIILVNLATVMVVSIISSVFDRYKSDCNIVVEAVCSLYAIASSAFICFFLSSIARNDTLTAENNTLESMLHQKGEQLAITKETIDIINVKCHDMKHRIAMLRDKMNDEDLDELEKSIDIYDVSLHTENDILDLLLAEKGLLCRNEKIRFNCIVDGKLLAFMDDTDLYAMFGNAMDNAIDAVLGLSEDKKIINLSVREAAGMVAIHMDNWYSGEITFKEDLPVTTKEDKVYHGYGLKSIKRTVEKYGGFMSVSADGEIFKLNITFPLMNTD